MMTYRTLILGLSVLVLAGCDQLVYEPSHVSQNKVQVQEEAFFEDVSVSKLDDAYVAALSNHYQRFGDGGLELTVTYDPQSKSNTAMKASNEASRLISEFRDNGVSDVEANIMPLGHTGSDARVLVSYQAYSAVKPEDCDMMPGFKTRHVDTDEDYELGCTFDTVFARQVARPKDLKGRQPVNPTSDGRKASNIIEVYRTGARNEPLDGESASGSQ